MRDLLAELIPLGFATTGAGVGTCEDCGDIGVYGENVKGDTTLLHTFVCFLSSAPILRLTLWNSFMIGY